MIDLRDNNATYAEPRLTIQNLAVAVTNALSTLLEATELSSITKLAASFGLTVHAFNAFQVQAKFGVNAPYVTIASLTADYTTPKGFILAASGDLTALAIGATGFIEIDTTGMSSLRIQASSASASGTLCDVNANGST